MSTWYTTAEPRLFYRPTLSLNLSLESLAKPYLQAEALREFLHHAVDLLRFSRQPEPAQEIPDCLVELHVREVDPIPPPQQSEPRSDNRDFFFLNAEQTKPTNQRSEISIVPPEVHDVCAVKTSSPSQQ